MPTTDERFLIEGEIGRLNEEIRSLKIQHHQAKRELQKLAAEVMDLQFEGSVLEEERLNTKTRPGVDLARYRSVRALIDQHQAAMEVRVAARSEARSTVRRLEQGLEKIRGQRQVLRTSLAQVAQIMLFPGGSRV